MNKLNVTEGEWIIYQDEMTNLYVVNTPEDEEGFSIGVVEGVYDKNDAILISQSKKLYEQLETTNNELAFVINAYNKLVKDPCDFFDAETCHLNQTLLAQCRGEQPTCKN